MSRTLGPLLRHWPLAAALVAAAMLAIAHAFESFGGLAPCTLCLRQREVYWVVLAVGLVGGALSNRPGVRRLASAALAAIFLVGAAIAIYHAGAEWKIWPGPTTCSATATGVDPAALSRMLGGARVVPPRCDEAAWVFAGLSMAGWNALASLVLTALSVAAARIRP